MLARKRDEKMDNGYKFDLNNKQLVKILKLILIALLLVIEILVCAQYVTLYMSKGGTVRLIFLIVCCVVLAATETVHAFAVKNFAVSMVFYGFGSLTLLVMCFITGNSYLSMLYCVVLTQYYIAAADFKTNTILFAVGSVLFIISFVCGWVAVNKGASLYESVVRIFGDCMIGVVMLVIHYVVCNFLLKFYSTNARLRIALREADESKARIKEMSDKLLKTAVFEERNRIAKDIHDNAGHSITTVIMQTEAAKLLMDTDPEEAKNRIISANIQAKNALEQMRESVHLLAGREQTKPLKDEIETIIAQTIDGTDLKVRCDLADVQVEENAYRYICNSVKECLANGIRHGKATAFYFELKYVFSDICLYISDNGCGNDGEIKEGFGLRGMREKAEELGGRCTFSSEAGEGFEVEITLPGKVKQNNDVKE